MQRRQAAVEIIKESLLKAQSRAKNYADRNRKERKLSEGHMVYLRVQTYRHTSLSLHRSLKLQSKYYGPYRVLKKIGEATYRFLVMNLVHDRGDNGPRACTRLPWTQEARQLHEGSRTSRAGIDEREGITRLIYFLSSHNVYRGSLL
jgi:hypothetical protein